MLQQYVPVVLMIGLGLGLGVFLCLLATFVSVSRPDREKCSPYECGFEPFESARIPFDIRFYLVAILFIIFDLETAFLVPWAVVFRHLHWFGLVAMAVFLGLLVVGFIYEWKVGGLEWE
jgi:NADH-quinone oxidoreductase subunit A